MNIDANALKYATVKGLAVPTEGPRAVPLTLDFSVSQLFSLLLQNVQARNFISLVQGVYLDNSAGASPMSVSFPASGQTIIIAPHRQGYFNVACPNPAQINFASAGTDLCFALLLNYPVTDHDWPCITGA